jgi:heat shock protein HtpX
MEMCVDNPRSGFADLFATHPPIERRIDAIVKFAGGRDPGPLALPEPEQPADAGAEENVGEQAPAGPWGGSGEPQPAGDKPFLPSRPPRELGGSPPGAGESGPWGPHRKN